MASPTAPTVDAAGITAPTYDEVLAHLQQAYRAIYGADTYLENDSQDGQFLALVALAIHDSNSATIAVWNSFSPSSARGEGLSSIVKTNGIARLSASYSTVDLTLTGTPGTLILGGAATDADGMRWNLPASVTIGGAASVTVTATADDLGEITAAPGSITDIATPTRGWATVTNAAAATPGAPVETDPQLKARQRISVMLPSRAVMDGIAGAIANLPGVVRQTYRENPEDATSPEGLPPHSIAFVVEGGNSTAIAQAIRAKKTPGATTVGTTTVNLTASNGVSQPWRFYRPTLRPISATITIQAHDGYTDAVGLAIRQAVTDYINARNLGEDLITGRLYMPAQLYGGPALEFFGLESIVTAIKPGTQTADDILIAFNQRMTAALADIALTVLP